MKFRSGEKKLETAPSSCHSGLRYRISMILGSRLDKTMDGRKNMKISRKKLHIAIFISLLLLLALICLEVWYPTLPLINILNGISTVVVACFTCIYALITYGQFENMNLQLDEMKLERFLQNQPVLSVDKNISVSIKKPYLYANPLEQTFEYVSKCRIAYQVGNFSTNSAICVDMITRLVFQDGTEIKSRADRIDVLGANQSFITTMIYPDSGLQLGKILNALIEDRLKLRVAVLYRTIMGGYFSAQSSYLIMPKNKEVIEALREWADDIMNAESKMKVLEQRSSPEKQDSDLKNELDVAALDFIHDFYVEAISKEYKNTNLTSEEYERKQADFAACRVPIPSSHVKITDMNGAYE
jgi:hypothetical protein